jgi:hypothetical protein
MARKLQLLILRLEVSPGKYCKGHSLGNRRRFEVAMINNFLPNSHRRSTPRPSWQRVEMAARQRVIDDCAGAEFCFEGELSIVGCLEYQ